ncbi:MAG TPA: TIGR00282 family metallophosphoesterase [Candidatus Saccharimonadales bacterium]|nr:TIGR00282 family metallophosphoesterase [Candidatus Saccharimonadales bacterium]
MNILYVGDVMGEPGLEVIEKVLPGLRKDKKIDLVIVQAENVSDGRGITLEDLGRLQKAGADFFTGGNWSLHHDDILPAMNDPQQPIIRPANYPEGTPGRGYKYIQPNGKMILTISLLGNVVGRDADKPVDNPLHVIDRILKAEKDTRKDAVIVNFHGDYSSQKVMIGHYLDGRVTAVIGDHWHIPTADARVLPGGTAYISDVGMVGTLDSSLGVKWDVVIPRWRDGAKSRNEVETEGPRQFNAVLIKSNEQGLADSIEPIRRII